MAPSIASGASNQGATHISPLWSRVRRSDLRHLARVAAHRAQRALGRRSTPDGQWNGSIPDLSRLRDLVPLPTAAGPAIGLADEVRLGRFRLLGFPPFELGAPPDWHTDPSSGFRWDPTTRPGGLDLMTRDSPADARVVWELNRFHHAVTLGVAQRLTGDVGYAAAFVSHVSDWLTANPTGYGVNWACAMETAIRSINWLIACALMQEALPERFVRGLLGALLTHGRAIRSNLEYALVTMNHYLADLCGLAVLGLTLPGQEPSGWATFALSELELEMQFQVYGDGVDFEASTGYHRLATELFGLPLQLARLRGVNPPSALQLGVKRMDEFSLAITRPDGSWPSVGDSDDGRVLRIARQMPRAQEGASPLIGCSQAFPEAGIYVMRHGDCHLVCDCGPNGQRGLGGHAHNDTLSFELYAGRPWIVDPGTYSYTGNLSDYDWFRSTAAHNTLVVDGEEQARFDRQEPFLLAPDARPTVHRWSTTHAFDLLDAEHAGYDRFPLPVTHRRQIMFDKQRRLWIARDIISGRGLHRLDWYFHFSAPPTAVRTAPKATILASSNVSGGLVLAPIEGPMPRLTLDEGWVSSRYGSRDRAAVAHFSLNEVTLPITLTYALVPAADPPSAGDAVARARQSLLVLEAQE